jgi:hypothetical protein
VRVGFAAPAGHTPAMEVRTRGPDLSQISASFDAGNWDMDGGAPRQHQVADYQAHPTRQLPSPCSCGGRGPVLALAGCLGRAGGPGLAAGLRAGLGWGRKLFLQTCRLRPLSNVFMAARQRSSTWLHFARPMLFFGHDRIVIICTIIGGAFVILRA